MQNQISSTSQILLTRFSGQVLIPFIEAAEAAGFAGQTARNLSSRGEFPIQTVMVRSRRFIHLADLAAFIDGLRQPKQKRGAQSKKERIEAEMLQGNGRKG